MADRAENWHFKVKIDWVEELESVPLYTELRTRIDNPA